MENRNWKWSGFGGGLVSIAVPFIWPKMPITWSVSLFTLGVLLILAEPCYSSWNRWQKSKSDQAPRGPEWLQLESFRVCASNRPEAPLICFGRWAVTTDLVRVFVDVADWRGEEWSKTSRAAVTEERDVVKGTSTKQISLLRLFKHANGEVLLWGTPGIGLSEPPVVRTCDSRVRVVFIGPDGREQHFPFLIRVFRREPGELQPHFEIFERVWEDGWAPVH